MDYFPRPEDLTEGITAEQLERAAGWERLMPVRDQVLKALDTAREDKVIGSSLEAAVFLRVRLRSVSAARKLCSGASGMVHRFASERRARSIGSRTDYSGRARPRR